MDPATIRAWWWHRQGLGGALAGESAAGVLSRTGWARSVGGVGPYLALFARAGIGRAAVDEAVARVEIHELPAVRGCTYVVPASDYALALRAGQGDDAEMNSAKKHLGVTEREIEKLSAKVHSALARGPLDPAALKEALGSDVRHLGDAGKKRGLTTTLPLALGRMQSRGEIRRVSSNGRLDQQRYLYARWEPSPLAGSSLDGEALACELATRFFRWAGPATVTQFAWWSGLGAKASKAAAAAIGVLPLDDGDERMMLKDDREAFRDFAGGAARGVSLVSSLDNITHLRRTVAGLLDARDEKKATWGDKGSVAIGTVVDLASHAIVAGGRLVGLWEFDADAQTIAWSAFGARPDGLEEAIARTERYVRDDLGDARSFSLDSPESRRPRIDALRKRAKG